MKGFWIFTTIITSWTASVFYFTAQNPPKIKTEYQLEILNQDSVKVYSNSTKRTYIVPFDEVETVLLKDNL